ncbi:MAG: hypothetical protein RLZZ385_341 [Pseudomonadota bacterium]|jgi:hypothetical protein
MKTYTGSCHCGAISFEFSGPEIASGLRCNCSICRRKGATMTDYVVGPKDIRIKVAGDALGTYVFGTGLAKHHFCRTCGIYTFHQTRRQPGFYRINTGCLDGVDSPNLPFKVYDGASL